MSDSSDNRAACDRCLSRRGFLGHAVALPTALAAVAHLLEPASADAAPSVRPIAPIWSDGPEHRYPIPAGDGVSIDQANQVILVRDGGRVMAFNLACPHENTALRWRKNDHRFQCPRHESKYAPDGTFIEGRATRNMDRLPIRRDGTEVVVDLSRMIKSDEQPDAWAADAVTLS